MDDSNTKQQCPEMEIETMDVKMCEEPCIDEDAPVGSSLRRSSRKAACNATDSSRLQAEEWDRRKSSQQDGAHKRQAVGSPQAVELTMSDPLYIPISDSKSSGIHGSVMCLEPRKEVVPTTSDGTACLEEMECLAHSCKREEDVQETQ